MNRHIYGLTLFLFIVKIHFLLYWAFFAPINFFSTQEAVTNRSVLIAKEPGKNCNLYKKREAKLQNAAIDIENLKVSANVRFNDLQTAFDARDFQARLTIFNEEITTTVYLKPAYSVEAGTVVSFKGELPQGEKWNPHANYYTQVDFDYSGAPKGWKQISSIEQAVPVLIIRDKHR